MRKTCAVCLLVLTTGNLSYAQTPPDQPRPVFELVLADASSPRPGRTKSSAKQTPTYIDKLIDPSKRVDDAHDWSDSGRPSADRNLYQSIEYGNRFHDGSSLDHSISHHGINYIAATSSQNYGNFRLHLTAGDDADHADNRYLYSDDTLRYYSLEQVAMPLTGRWSMDNTLGTHRVPSQRRNILQNTINYRFNASVSDIIGLSSQLYSNDNNSRIALSYGKLGQSSGHVFRGLEKTDSELALLQYAQNYKQQNIQISAWDLDDHPSNHDDRKRTRPQASYAGGRLQWTSKLSDQLTTSAIAGFADDANAFLAGINYDGHRHEHELGAYYFDEDFRWVNRLIGNDSRGLYYKLRNTSTTGLMYNGSIEYQTRELSQDTVNNLFLNTNTSYRLNYGQTLSLGYQLRDKQHDKNPTADSQSHYARVNLGHRWSNRARGNLGVSHRLIDKDQHNDDTLSAIRYRIERDFNYGLNLSVDTGYEQEKTNNNDIDRYRLGLGVDKTLGPNANINLDINYNNANGENNRSTHWSYSSNINWLLTDRLSLTFAANYSDNVHRNKPFIESDSGLLTDLFVDSDSLENKSHNLYASFNLRYQLGHINRGTTLGARQGLNGSGELTGRVYIDENRDGRWQPHEKGLAGVTVFLDKIYPVVTNSKGEYYFNRVGVGEHTVFIDQNNLPLPWVLENETAPFTIQLRRSSRVDIPVTELQ